MTPEAIIFDLDGTLVDSAPDLHLSANLMLSDLKRPEQSLEAVTGFVGNGVAKLVERCLRATGGIEGTSVDAALGVFNRHYRNNLTTLTRPYSGVPEQLEQLQRDGIKLAICTNKPEPLAQGVCEELNLSLYFSEITGAVDGVPRKPDPQMLLKTICDLETTATKSLFVGDSAVDQKTADNACVDFAFFTGGYLNAPVSEISARHKFNNWNEFDPHLGDTSGA